jgi:hypothetical protein
MPTVSVFETVCEKTAMGRKNNKIAKSRMVLIFLKVRLLM